MFWIVLKVMLHSSTDNSMSNVSVAIKMHHGNCVKHTFEVLNSTFGRKINEGQQHIIIDKFAVLYHYGPYVVIASEPPSLLLTNTSTCLKFWLMSSGDCAFYVAVKRGRRHITSLMPLLHAVTCWVMLSFLLVLPRNKLCSNAEISAMMSWLKLFHPFL